VEVSRIPPFLASSKFSASKVLGNVQVKKREGFVPVSISRCAGWPSLAESAVFPGQQALRNAQRTLLLFRCGLLLLMQISIYQSATLLTWICERSSSARATLTVTCSEDIKYRLGNPQVFGQLDLRCHINERSRDLVNRLLRALVGGSDRG
jgi:hypothetical protein